MRLAKGYDSKGHQVLCQVPIIFPSDVDEAWLVVRCLCESFEVGVRMQGLQKQMSSPKKGSILGSFWRYAVPKCFGLGNGNEDTSS